MTVNCEPLTVGGAPFTLTNAAVARIQELMRNKADMKGLRVGVTVKGCSGFVHTLAYATGEEQDDIVVTQDAVTVWVKPDALPIVQGTTLDYIEEDLEARFVFYNPNAKGTCGCGESFHIED